MRIIITCRFVNMCDFLDVFRHSISAITDPAYFSDERGYQGQLYAEINNRINANQLFPGNPIIQQEYQKIERNHGIRIRPDLVIHIPFERGNVINRRHGNFVVIQLKRRSSLAGAIDDFNKIDLMFYHLDYPLGIFLNIDSENNYYDNYNGDFQDRLHCFSVILDNGTAVINESP